MERGTASARSISCTSGSAKMQHGCSKIQNVAAAFEKPVELRGAASCLNSALPSGDKAEIDQRHLIPLLAGGHI